MKLHHRSTRHSHTQGPCGIELFYKTFFIVQILQARYLVVIIRLLFRRENVSTMLRLRSVYLSPVVIHDKYEKLATLHNGVADAMHCR